MKFSKKLQKLRKERKLSQEKFADMLDVSRQAVNKWENARGIPEISNLKQMRKDFNITLDEILDGEYSKKNYNFNFIYIYCLLDYCWNIISFK